MNFRKTIFFSINVFFCIIQLFKFNQSFAEGIVYSHAVVTTSLGEKIPVEVADTHKKKKPWTWETVLSEKRLGDAFCF